MKVSIIRKMIAKLPGDLEIVIPGERDGDPFLPATAWSAEPLQVAGRGILNALCVGPEFGSPRRHHVVRRGKGGDYCRKATFG